MGQGDLGGHAPFTLQGALRVAAPALVAVLLCFSPTATEAQTAASRPDSAVTLVPGAQFNRGGFFRFFWGSDYRKEWNTRVRVPVLDLDSFAGGLTPLEMGGPGQSLTLYLQGGDGRRYAFRSIVKELGVNLPGVIAGSPVGTVMQDLTSAIHPAAPLISAPLEAAAQVRSVRPSAYLMPDSPRLGEHREAFAETLGTIQPITAGGVINSDTLFQLLRKDPADRVDSRALLAARLVDMFLGDWDRDRRQWHWVRGSVDRKWRPIAHDRDEAFVRMDGLFPSTMHFVMPQLVGFKADYPSIAGLTYTGQELDRQFLADLERPAWDSIAANVAARLTDEVIDTAVRQQPPEMYEIGGPLLAERLRQRRQTLHLAAADFYEVLAGDVEVHGTDVAETVWITGMEDGAVEVVLARRAEGAPAYFQRLFQPGETNEIRVRLHGGDDVALLRGDPAFGLRVRIIGGQGDDEYRFIVPARKVNLYDETGTSRITGEGGRGKRINTRSYEKWEYSEETPIPRRQWGSRWFPAGRVMISSDFGLFIGLGAQRLSYAFRKDPYSTKLRLLGGISTDALIHFLADFDTRFENSRSRIRSRAVVSQLTQTHFYGFGNETLNPPEVDSRFFDVDRTIYAGEVAGARFPTLSEKIDMSLGTQLSLSRTGDNEGRFISFFPDLYGGDEFAEVGFFLDFELDTRDLVANPSRGAHIDVRGTIQPAWLDAVEAYLPLDLVGSYYVTPKIPLRPTLAFRAGSRIVWGQFPYFRAAYIGGLESLRGWASQRFAGDASLYGGMDLRIKVVEIKKFLPGPFGVLGLVDVGRVWQNGESPGGFHVGYGGGIWTGFLGRGQTVSVTVAAGEEQISVYVGYGFAF